MDNKIKKELVKEAGKNTFLVLSIIFWVFVLTTISGIFTLIWNIDEYQLPLKLIFTGIVGMIIMIIFYSIVRENIEESVESEWRKQNGPTEGKKISNFQKRLNEMILKAKEQQEGIESKKQYRQ